MNHRLPIATLTWGTFAGAVFSACLLAAGESALPELPGHAARAHAVLPTEPSAAGLQRIAGRPLADAGSNPSGSATQRH